MLLIIFASYSLCWIDSIKVRYLGFCRYASFVRIQIQLVLLSLRMLQFYVIMSTFLIFAHDLSYDVEQLHIKQYQTSYS